MIARKPVLLLLVVVSVMASGCSVVGRSAVAHPLRSVPGAAPAPGKTRGQGATSADLRLLVEPEAGYQVIDELIEGARRSVDLTMYELDDPVAERDLAAAAARGVDVRVILDAHLERIRNRPAYQYLRDHRVQVTWGPATTTYHQKTLTVDGDTSAIMTGNLVSYDYCDTRDFVVIDTIHADVVAITDTFDADFAHRQVVPPTGSGDLVWSPTNSQSTLLWVINHARHTLAVENEEMSSDRIVAALAAAAGRGVDVMVTMTADGTWDWAFDQLARDGVHVAVYPDTSGALYIHAKAIVADAGLPGAEAFVGSENFSTASLDHNRELGIVISVSGIVNSLAARVDADHDDAQTWASA